MCLRARTDERNPWLPSSSPLNPTVPSSEVTQFGSHQVSSSPSRCPTLSPTSSPPLPTPDAAEEIGVQREGLGSSGDSPGTALPAAWESADLGAGLL